VLDAAAWGVLQPPVPDCPLRFCCWLLTDRCEAEARSTGNAAGASSSPRAFTQAEASARLVKFLGIGWLHRRLFKNCSLL